MEKQSLPTAFKKYWNIQGTLLNEQLTQTNKEHLSKEWLLFLEAIQTQVEKDMNKEK